MPTKSVSLDVDLNLMLNKVLRSRNKSFPAQMREWIVQAYKEVENDPVLLKLADSVELESASDKWTSYIRVGLDHRLFMMLTMLTDPSKTNKGNVVRELITQTYEKTLDTTQTPHIE